MDWEAEQRRLEEEQQRRAEEQRQAIEEQARRDQEAYQQLAEERAAQARAAQMSMYAPPPPVEAYDPRQYDEGPRETGYAAPPMEPAPPEAPASFADTVGGLWQQTFGAAPPPPGPPPEAEPPAEPEAPPLGFADTVSGLWQQTFGTPGPTEETAQDADRGPREALPGSLGAMDLTPPPRPYAPEQVEAMTPPPEHQVPPSPEPWSLGRISEAAAAATGPGGFLEPLAGGPRITGRMEEIRHQAAAEQGRSPIDLRVTDDPGWRTRHPEQAAELDALEQEHVLGLVGQVGDVPRIAGRAGAALEAAAAPTFRARPGNLPDELIPRAEPGGGLPEPRPGAAPPLEPTVFEPPASARAPAPPPPPATPQIGDRIVLPDGDRGVVGSLGQQRRGGQLLSWMTVKLEGGGSRQVQLPPAGGAPPGGRPPAPPGAPPPAGGPPPPPEPPPVPPSAEVARLRLDKFPEELRPHIQQAAEEVNFGWQQRRGVVSDEAVQAGAASLPTTIDQWIKRGRIGRAYNAEEAAAMRNLVAGQARRVDDATAEIARLDAAGETVPAALLVQAHAEGEKLASLVNVVEGARAEAGRGLRLWRAEARPQDPADAAARLFNKFGEGEAGRKQALKALREFNEIPPEDVISKARFWAMIEAGGKITLPDALTAIRYSSMLSSPSTWEIAWIGSIFQAAPKVASDVMAAAARPLSGELGEAAKGAAVGFRRGLRPFIETIRHGITTEQAAAGQIPRGLAARAVSPASRRAWTLVDIPGRMVSAPDALFTSVFSQGELGRQAAISAHRQGLKGTARDRFIAEFLAAPPKEAEAEVTRIVDSLMLRGEEGAIGKRIEAVGNSLGPLWKSFFVPFSRVSYHLWSQGVELSPVGTVGTVADIARGAAGFGPYAKGFGGGSAAPHVRPLAERARYNTIGLGITAASVLYALDGGITGLGPDDPEKRNELMATGWRPYSIKIGDTWVSYANWGATAVPLSMAAAYAENRNPAYRRGKADRPSAEMLDMVKRVAALATEQTFLQGIGTIFRAWDQPDIYGPQVITGALTSTIPLGGLLNRVAASTDPYQRRPERVSQVGAPENIWQGVEARLPGFRQQVPEARGPLGERLPNLQSGIMAYQPFGISPERDDPVYEAFIRTGIDIGRPPSEVTEQGREIRLTPDEQRRFQETMGTYLRSRIGPPRTYEGPQGAARLQKLYDASRTYARTMVVRSIPRAEQHRRGVLKPKTATARRPSLGSSPFGGGSTTGGSPFGASPFGGR